MSIDVAAVTAGDPDAGDAAAPETLPGAYRPADRSAGRYAGWWRAWRDRFGLAEVCGTLAAVAGFATGYVQAGSLLAAAALATVCEAIGFYGCVGAKTVASARRATAHLGGCRRLAAGAWHAVHEQLASCAVAETLDGFLIRPGCLAGAAWLLRPLPGGVWLGFVAGKAVADVAWYGLEASARRGVTVSLSALRLGSRGDRPSLACEPGRAIAAPAGTMVASVIGTGRSAFNGYPAPGVRIVRPGSTPGPVRDREKALA